MTDAVLTKPVTRKEALELVFEKLSRAEEPYLITGFQATYQYHRWRTPVEGQVFLLVYPHRLSWWTDYLSNGSIQVLTAPAVSSIKEIRQHVTVVLQWHLTVHLFRRRRQINGLNYISPEDLCLELIESAQSEAPIAEAAAILVVQRQNLDWDRFCRKAIGLGLAREVGIIFEVINQEAHKPLIPQTCMEALLAEAKKMSVGPDLEEQYYPFVWRVKYAILRDELENMPLDYPEISERWGVKVALPRHVVSKVLFDLRSKWYYVDSAE